MYQSVSVVVMVAMLVLVPVDSFKWTQCGPKDAMIMHSFNIGPDPVKVGQPLSLSVHAQTFKTLNGSDIKLQMGRKTFLLTIPVPCLYHFGSCTYRDSCTLMQRMKDENWGGKTADLVLQVESLMAQHNINLKCPVPPQKMDIDGFKLNLPALPKTAALLLEGDYKIKITATDRLTKKINFCFEIELSIDA
ncbi:ganglioside GM2 activator-like [Argonauta hians]